MIPRTLGNAPLIFAVGDRVRPRLGVRSNVVGEIREILEERFAVLFEDGVESRYAYEEIDVGARS